MPERKFDPDERFSLHPLKGEAVVETLLNTPKDETPRVTKTTRTRTARPSS